MAKFNLVTVLGVDASGLKQGTQEASKNFGQLKREFLGLKNISFAGKTEEEILKINTRMGQLKDEMSELNATQKVLGTNMVSVFAAGVRTAVGAVEIFTGAMQSFGLSEQDAAKMQSRMLALITMMQGMEAVEEAIATRQIQNIALRIKVSAAANYETISIWANTQAKRANIAAETARNVVMGEATLVTKAAALAQWAWNAAYAASPIGVILTIVGLLGTAAAALIYYSDKTVKAKDDTLELANALTEVNTELAKKVLAEYSLIFYELNGGVVEFGGGIEKLKTDLPKLGKVALQSIQEVLKDMVENFDHNTEGLTELQKAIKLKNWQELQDVLGLVNKRLGDFGDTRTISGTVGAYELLTTQIGELEKKIKNVQASGGIVSTADLNRLSYLQLKLEKINREFELYKKYGSQKFSNIPTLTSTNNNVDVSTDITKETTDTIIEEMNKRRAAYNDYTQAIEDSNKRLEESENLRVEQARAASNAIAGAFNFLGNNIVDSMRLADNGIQGFAKGIIKTFIDLATQVIAAALAASMGYSIEGATASSVGTGVAAVVTAPIFIATAIAGVLAAFASIPKFAYGGIVAGSSFTGDNLLAKVNSGEMILNQYQQSRLFNIINGSGNGGKEVVFRIEGKELVGVLSNYSRTTNKIR